MQQSMLLDNLLWFIKNGSKINVLNYGWIPELENMRKIPLNEGVIVHKILEIPLGGSKIPC